MPEERRPYSPPKLTKHKTLRQITFSTPIDDLPLPLTPQVDPDLIWRSRAAADPMQGGSTIPGKFYPNKDVLNLPPVFKAPKK